MHIISLSLRNFRLFKEATFTFSPQGASCHGENGRGKTALLEALFFLATGRSFRTSKTMELMRQGASSFIVEARFKKHEAENSLKVCWSSQERRIFFNNTSSSTLSSLLGILPAVVSTPDDLQIIKGGPQIRRQVLDLHLAQGDSLYIQWSARYHRALKQRNALLRAKEIKTLGVWEEEMAKAAVYVSLQRKKGIELLNGFLKQYLPFHLHYQLDINPEPAAYLETWERLRARELQIGHTLAGPHRDDIALLLDGKPLRAFGSEGEQRACMGALRFAEWNSLKERLGVAPLILIDDAGLSLDEKKKSWLAAQMEGKGQVILSSTEPWLYSQHLMLTYIPLDNPLIGDFIP